MPKTKNGGFILQEPEAAAGPYTPRLKDTKKKPVKSEKPAKTKGKKNL